jgi:hypothetical protein
VLAIHATGFDDVNLHPKYEVLAEGACSFVNH